MLILLGGEYRTGMLDVSLLLQGRGPLLRERAFIFTGRRAVPMAKFEQYISVGGARLRCGFTTGTCAAAAARGGAELLLTGEPPLGVQVETPAGPIVEAELLHFSWGDGWAACAVQKDGGDDPDVTDGTLIFARVEKIPAGFEIDGGQGVGRVTKPGLDQPIGAAAINRVPRQMIERELRAAAQKSGYTGGLRAVISVPEGEALAEKTFNPRLGIVGGISILGTGGIVRPMSEAALIDTMKVELNMLRAAGVSDLLVSPGNYGEHFARDVLGLDIRQMATCSNYLGEAIDHANSLGFRSFLLIGHLGKLVKVAAGCMNTHSKNADARRETLAAHTALAGGTRDLVQAVFDSGTTDEALELLQKEHLETPVLRSLTGALEQALAHRAGKTLDIQAVVFSNRFGLLAKTSGADRLLSLHLKEELK
jgi:cobalt-precorrin-5B (C1)-methyltransferase